MAPGSWFSLLTIAMITLGLQWPQQAVTFPAIPLSSLFANAVLRAQHLHLLAAETYKEFERTYIPEDQRHTNKNSQVAFCYSETIPAPMKKDDVQQKSDTGLGGALQPENFVSAEAVGVVAHFQDIELLQFSLVLIQSWLTPVQYLSKMFTNNLVFGTSDRVYEKLKDLEEGIQALMRLVTTARQEESAALSSRCTWLGSGLELCFLAKWEKRENYLPGSISLTGRGSAGPKLLGSPDPQSYLREI
ncbi:somatotropin-like isoform X1 [Vidua chalybeata]|uniref:somatotropin-like isoform X1 n=2 Tax=Vidua chalybeata TaxID=81927 RepID=UPI0023A88E35|nr:somatotropin-like isoform X1 [Vidua chalybeata]